MKRFINSLSDTQMKILAVVYVIFLVTVGVLAIRGINSIGQDEQPSQPSYGVPPVTLESPENITPTKEWRPSMLISNYVYVGDSRYVAMAKYMDSLEVCISKNGVSAAFLEENKEMLASYDSANTVFVVGLGVNSATYYNPATFASSMNSFAASIQGRVCYTTVGPVIDQLCEQRGYGCRNSYIDAWNAAVIPLLDEDIVVIDLNSYLDDTGFMATDGLHYTEKVNQHIYDYIRFSVDEKL